MPSSHLILCRPLFLLPPTPPSIRVFSCESTLCMRWPKYWSFSFSIIPSKEHPELISFRMDWSDLLAVQRAVNFVYYGWRFHFLFLLCTKKKKKKKTEELNSTWWKPFMSAICPLHSALSISQTFIKCGWWQHICSSYLKFVQLESIAHAGWQDDRHLR